MVRRKKALIIAVSAALLVMVGLSMGISLLIKHNNRIAREDELQVTKIAVDKTKAECRKENKGDEVCKSITGTAGAVTGSPTICRGSSGCWIARAHAKDPYTYSADMFVKRSESRYTIINYNSNAVQPL